MKKHFLAIFPIAIMLLYSVSATAGIGLRFNRTGTNAQSVAVSVVDENGAVIDGASATLTSTHDLKATSGNVTSAIICPNINANTNPTIVLEFVISGIPADFTFNKIGLDIHALNSAGAYQQNNDNVTRHWNISSTVNGNEFGSLTDIDIAAGVGSTNGVHKVWEMEKSETVKSNGNINLKLTITKGTTNGGCFIGLSEVILSTGNDTTEPDPEPEPDLDEKDAKVYYIQWKNTGANYITEESDHRMTVQNNNVQLAQFWMFIPTGNENCFYIRNTATGRYIGSCNLTPSSNSKIYTSETPVEYYVGKTSATSGEIANCHYFSSTDCSNYDKESAGPRALNKDGASNYVITWQAGTQRVGSYWKLVETEDLYEIRPFEPSESIGKVGTSYNIESFGKKYLTISNGNATLAERDLFDETQEWYFVGTGNSTGWHIASAAEPAELLGIVNGNIIVGKEVTTKWKVNISNKQNGYFYFTSEGNTLVVDGDSLFRFKRVSSAFERKLQIYKNPCGAAGNNYIKSMQLHGKAALNNIIYESQSKPGSWHVVYAKDKAEVAKAEAFDIDITMSANIEANLSIVAHFDWNGDGTFETETPFTVNGTTATANVEVPEWAVEKNTRMRIRINSNGLDLAEDDLQGFAYDFHIAVVEPSESRTATVSVNSWERGKVTLSDVADSYPYGTVLTATANTYGTSEFVCWREEGVVVSTDAKYTFTVDHNVNLVAYFTPNTDEESYPTGINEISNTIDLAVIQDGNMLVAQGADVIRIALYTIDAAIIASNKGNSIDITALDKGIYIARITTAGGYKNVKVFINK